MDIESVNGNDGSFLRKLYKMIEDASTDGFEDILSWEPNGQSFAIRQLHEFATSVMPRYFCFARLSTFHRMLLRYGFSLAKAKQGQALAYHHKWFCRDSPGMSSSTLQRSKEVYTNIPVTELPPMIGCRDSEVSSLTEDGEDMATVVSGEFDQEAGAVEDFGEELQEARVDLRMPNNDIIQAAVRLRLLSKEGKEGSPPRMDLRISNDDIIRDGPPKARSCSIQSHESTPSPSSGASRERTPGSSKSNRAALQQTIKEEKKKAVLPGPLQIPGRLRNGFGMGIRAACIHSIPKGRTTARGTVVKAISMNLTPRREAEQKEWNRFVQPLLNTKISSEVNHRMWGKANDDPIPDTASNIIPHEM